MSPYGRTHRRAAEEVTDFRRTVPAEIYASSNDEEVKSHLRMPNWPSSVPSVWWKVKKTPYSCSTPSHAFPGLQCGIRQRWKNHDRGLDVRALEKPRQFFSAARNSEEAVAYDRGHRFGRDGVENGRAYFSGIQGTGNSEIILDCKVAELRLWRPSTWPLRAPARRRTSWTP